MHEQLKQLLVNKFRSKYCGPNSTEVDDLLIQREVTNFLKSNKMTEKNLILLDRKLNDSFKNNSRVQPAPLSPVRGKSPTGPGTPHSP